jgi:general secretion pathway protein F
MAGKLKNDELLEFTDGLAILVKADIPLDYALESLTGVLESPKLRKLCADLVRRVREGANLSFALTQSKAGFSEAYVGMVRVGEMGGTLDSVLEHLSRMLARNQELKRNLTSAVFYPLVLLGFSLLAVSFILVYVLPSFVSVFRDMNMPLPTAAEFLIWVGETMDQYGLLIVIFLGVVALLIVLAMRSPANRLTLARFVMTLGPIGKVVASWQTVVFCRSLGLMLDSGVPINEACRFATAAVANPAFRKALLPLESGLKEGSSLVAALSQVPYMPKVTVRMVALGERTGSLASMLQRVADLLESRVKFVMGRILVFTEPAIILFMGLLVGFVVVTMLTTIFTLTQGGM